MSIPHQAGRDTTFDLRHARIWAEISYLDSPSDYREYLPSRLPDRLPEHGEFVMLDSSGTFLRQDSSKPFLLPLGIIAILMVFGYLAVFVWTEFLT
jgi:hypothetical protein